MRHLIRELEPLDLLETAADFLGAGFFIVLILMALGVAVNFISIPKKISSILNSVIIVIVIIFVVYKLINK